MNRTPVELAALLDALNDTNPSALTSCPGWTAHHIAAHIAGNYEEVLRHVDAFAAGRPLERTRGWEEREKALRDVDHTELLGRIAATASATTARIGDILETDAGAELRWTNRTVPVSGFLTHMRSEDALHRWDLVGDDEKSRELLGQDDLLRHAVKFIGQPLLQRGLAAESGGADLIARVRCEDRDDLIIELRDGRTCMSVDTATDDASIETDPAARLLLLWGRKASPFVRLRSMDDDDRTGRIQRLLSGY
jgi:hypothetical protein